MPKPHKLSIIIPQPSNPHSQKSDKQLQIRQKHQIEQMQNEIRKLNDKIEEQRKILKNRILCQELQHEIKRNQIAAKMSKREIILNKLEEIRGRDRRSGGKDKNNSKMSSKQQNNNEKQAKSQVYSIKPQQSPPQLQKNSNPSLPKLSHRSRSGKLPPASLAQQVRLSQIQSLLTKQRQYGNRVQKQYHSNRAKSALSYLELQKHATLLQTKQLQQRARILQHLKKPSLPFQVNPKDRKREVDRIRASSQSGGLKLELLNYLAEIQVNRVARKELKGKGQGEGLGLEVLEYINKARTDIMLGDF